MFTGNPFKAIEIAEDDSSNSSAPDTIIEIVQGQRNKLSKPTPTPVKTSRFSSLFEKNLAGPSTNFANQGEEEQSNDRIPRYRVPRNGQGAKMSSPSPPRAPGETYPKRLFVDNIPYAATKKDLLGFFDGYNVESITWQRKPGVTSGHSGAGYVILGSEEEAKAAVGQLNGTVLKGRTVKVVRSKVTTGGGRKSQTEFTYARQQSKPSGPQPKIQTIDPASYNSGPIGIISDSASTLRKGVFDLACKSICNSGKTPDQIFQEINFNDEEKIMIRDFYFRYKQAQQNAPELFSPNPMMDMLELPCTTHGLTQCMECHQTLLLQKIHQEEAHKENMSSLTRAMHHHSLSWDSGATLHSATTYQQAPVHRNSMMATSGHVQPLLTEAALYPPLTAANALRLYGPKFVRENFPQQEPPIHNTIGQVPRGGFMADNPYSRQHAVVPTQPGVKTHCAYFLRTGRCDFAQQGCKFSHELPPGGQAELALPTARRTVSSPPSFFANQNLGQMGGVVYPDVAQRLAPLPDIDLIETIAPGRGIPPIPISRGPRLTEGEFSLVPRGGGGGGGSSRVSQPVFNRFQPLDDTPHVSARRRLATQPAQRQNSRPWREASETRRDISYWKQNSERQTGHHSETDGAADDEESSEDLISLSSFGH
ncbi:hypothetical protein TWF506_008656 [Arthrobotrys conoides]|uniref:RNA-binding protein n=1 Tax=Arthrobotrys conoides TaxID=74498 RepID=A0AAN8NDN2_9PEZI